MRPRCWLFNHVWAWSFSFIVTTTSAQAGSSNNVSIPNTSPQIQYTPFICNTSIASISDCDGSWMVQDVNGTAVVSTTGPSNEENNIIPQMFLQFRASALYLQTSALSNATMNVTVSSGGFSVTVPVLSQVGNIAIVNIQESQTTTLSITYLGPSPSRLDIGSISMSVSVSNDSATFLPTATLPPSIVLPAFTPQVTTSSSTSTSTASSSSNLNHSRLVSLAVGLTVGLGLGLTVLITLAFYLWRRRRLKRDPWSPPSNTSPPNDRSWF